MRTEKDVLDACMASLDRWMAALNAHDCAAMDEEMHFPHMRLAGGRAVIYERPGSNPMDLFNSLMNDSDWQRSEWMGRHPLQANDEKVHMTVTYARYAKDDTVIGIYDSLYVMVKVNGKWKTQIRSSFGP
jgi:hypothetical protein